MAVTLATWGSSVGGRHSGSSEVIVVVVALLTGPDCVVAQQGRAGIGFDWGHDRVLQQQETGRRLVVTGDGRKCFLR